MKIPIVKAGQEMPETGPVYVIGKDGFYLRKQSTLFDAIVKVDTIPDFEGMKESLTWTAPKLPYSLIEEALEFFRVVYDQYEAEAIVMLSLNNEIWQNTVPEQRVGRANLDYQTPKIEGLAGTIHSHGNMDAFFSDTDHKDVAGFDGVHIVLGKIDRNVPRIKAGVYVNGRLFEFKPEELIEGIPEEHVVNADHPWMSQVKGMKSKVRSTGFAWSSCRGDIWDDPDFDGFPF